MAELLKTFFRQENEKGDRIKPKEKPSKKLPVNLKTEDYQHDDHKSFLIEENLKQSFKFLEQSESKNDSTYYHDSISPEKTSVGKQKYSISFISEISMKIKI